MNGDLRPRGGCFSMNVARVLFGVAGMLMACGSSSNIHDDGSSDSGGGGDSAGTSDAAKSCNPFGTPMCARGQTCCFSGPSGTCTDLGTCTSPAQFECDGPGSCKPGEVCCGTFVPPPGFQASDASAPSQDIDGGLGQLLMGATAMSFCAASCSSPSARLCRTGTDCAAGATCSVLPEGSTSAILAAAAESFAVCAPPDSGAPPSEDGGSEGSGSAGDASDASSGD